MKFFSKTMGSQKRLPNANTFIAEDNTGRLFQIKPDGTIVWEYVNRGGTTRPSVVPYDFIWNRRPVLSSAMKVLARATLFFLTTRYFHAIERTPGKPS